MRRLLFSARIFEIHENPLSLVACHRRVARRRSGADIALVRQNAPQDSGRKSQRHLFRGPCRIYVVDQILCRPHRRRRARKRAVGRLAGWKLSKSAGAIAHKRLNKVKIYRSMAPCHQRADSQVPLFKRGMYSLSDNSLLVSYYYLRIVPAHV